MQDEDHDIGFQDPDAEDMPSEMKDHMLAAFRHGAGLGPHPGMYKGPTRRKGHDPDAPTETDLQRAQEEPIGEEASAKKMHAAQIGGGDTALGPSQIEQQTVKQRTSVNQQADLQSAAQAQQVAGKQVPSQPPPAPTGPQGTSIPYSTQKGAVGGPGNAPKPQGAPPPDQGPPPDEEQGPPQ